MRYATILAIVLMAGVCRAEDPLESLNTVEDTLQTMHRILQAQTLEHRKSLAPGMVANGFVREQDKMPQAAGEERREASAPRHVTFSQGKQ